MGEPSASGAHVLTCSCTLRSGSRPCAIFDSPRIETEANGALLT
jgi:hypothetical protein